MSDFDTWWEKFNPGDKQVRDWCLEAFAAGRASVEAAPSQEPVGEVSDSGRGAFLYLGCDLDDGTLLYTTPPDAAAQIAEMAKILGVQQDQIAWKDEQIAKLEAAARMALEALELHAKQYPHMQKGYTVDAITALRDALGEK